MKKAINFIVLAFCLSACDYLNMVPENDIETIPSIFETRVNAMQWRDGTYGMINEIVPDFCQNAVYLGADEFVACQSIENLGYDGKYYLPGFRIAAGEQMSQMPYGDYWSRGNEYDMNPTLYEVIRSCNTFLENIDNVYNMQDREKEEWAAEIKALKAYCYFELVRRYGPIVLVPKNIDMANDVSVMQLPRSHVDTCFKAIVRLCDEAAAVLPTQQEKSVDRQAYFSKEAALMLKARALLYAASPLFNGNVFYSDFVGRDGEPLFSTQADPEKWRLAAEAADEAVAVAEAAGHYLVSGNTGHGSDLRNVMYDIEHSVLSDFDNPEMILEWKAQGDPYLALFCQMILPRVNTELEPGSTPHFDANVKGGLSPSMKMVEMYYTENGVPIDLDNTWNYSGRYTMTQEASSDYSTVVPLNQDVLQLHLRREPRFYACIAADRTYWQRGPSNSYDDNNLLVTAYKGEYFGSQFDIITSTGYQNINGYWCKKHLDSEVHTYGYTQSSDHTMPMMRLAELYLMQAEAWNEYEGPSDKVYVPLNKVRERAGIPDVVTAWKSYSMDPGRVDTKTGMRDIIQREWNIEFAFEGVRFFNLRRWVIAHETLNEKQMGWNVLGETASQFYNNWNGPIVVWSQSKFTSPRDYLFPINAEEILISSIVQNPGW